MTEPAPISGFSHLQLLVSDFETSRSWYTTVLGLVEKTSGVSDGRPYALLVHKPSKVGLVLQTATGPLGEHRGVDHVAFAAPDRESLEKFVARLDELGIDHPGIADVPEGASLVLPDPDGVGVELLAPHPRP